VPTSDAPSWPSGRAARPAAARAAGWHPEQGVYVISVVTQLTGVEAHKLRAYERAGLIRPQRSAGGIRHYSDTEVQLVRRIAELTSQGITLAGVRRILELEARSAELQARVTKLEARVTKLEARNVALATENAQLRAENARLRTGLPPW